MILLTLTALAAVLVLVALRREFARLDRERRLREYVRTSPDFAEMTRALVNVRLTFVDNFTPALKKATADIARMGEALRKAGESR